jgi:hypothetical protein
MSIKYIKSILITFNDITSCQTELTGDEINYRSTIILEDFL